jgi:hypothetical protein
MGFFAKEIYANIKVKIDIYSSHLKVRTKPSLPHLWERQERGSVNEATLQIRLFIGERNISVHQERCEVER